MIAVDTNVVVRFLVNDDPEQSPRALALMRRNEILIGATVLLETEWVLRGAYKLPRDRLRDLLVALLGLPNVRLSQPAQIAKAITLFSEGMDFADALHLSVSDEADSFVTFDTGFVRLARQLKLNAVTMP